MNLSWPRSLLGRNCLLLILLVFITNISSITVFVFFVQKPRIDNIAQLIASQIITLDNVLAKVPSDQRAEFIQRVNGSAVLPEKTFSKLPSTPWRGYEGALFLKRLYSYLPANMHLSWQTLPERHLWVQVNVAGEPYWITLPAIQAVPGIGIMSTLLLSFGLSLLALLLVYAIHLRINRPLTSLALAAQSVGAGKWPEPLSVDGPSEIAAVSKTFNNMIERLIEFEANRTTILAGISHDIRTPLTKLRLALAMQAIQGPNNEEGFGRYFDDIDNILQQFIDFARGSADEPLCDGDITRLIKELAQDFAGLGQEFILNLAPVEKFDYRPVAMMRLLMNLMGNAVKYGQRELEIACWPQDNRVFIAVRDRGPAVSDAELEQIKSPFNRGKSQDRPQGGSGLGLAIAEQIAQQHQGTLTLRRRTGGGLEALLAFTLPSSE
ncbi:ATP-binding protein [Sodalis sp. dw_96]|uniref:ATP-binding protein n=1 Tax=Sodalis sp. dw_96 TaxID=2719794 RepID=UPI001BD4649D|nr:ATP-binding protein [Sodalis sp. dw_96]